MNGNSKDTFAMESYTMMEQGTNIGIECVSKDWSSLNPRSNAQP